MSKTTLLDAAKRAAENAYAPYSKFKVGAAIETDNGEIITGCNVENVSFGLSNCAERTAIYRAIAEGIAPSSIKHIAIYTPTDEMHSPCGACRQVIAEFCSQDTVFISTNKTSQKTWSVGELLPDSFSF
ncbi:cytidine deaminase [Idiomarina sp.]|uniref:cytidine deaminase n=1 Tax=Idiomarina sp. TaxID=1874361 RepID=UPI0025C2D420|nr:cytidine deaminase [Idiomarina sp.]